MLLSPLQISWGTSNVQKPGHDENLPEVNKTKQPPPSPPPKKRDRERYKMEGPKSRQKERTTHKGRSQKDMKQIKYLNPHGRNISDKEREGTPERTLSLQEPPTAATTTTGEDTVFRTEFTSWPNPRLLLLSSI
jgi:hypothetical protein